MSDQLNHFNVRGEAHMVDVGDKEVTQRRAVAEGFIQMKAETLQRIIQGEHKKGDVLGIARVAGIMAAKKTSDLIPLCHPLQLNNVDIQLMTDEEHSTVHCIAEVKTSGKTGVEMEALTGLSVALLTIWDLVKPVNPALEISAVRLLYKSGGKSGTYERV